MLISSIDALIPPRRQPTGASRAGLGRRARIALAACLAAFLAVAIAAAQEAAPAVDEKPAAAKVEGGSPPSLPTAKNTAPVSNTEGRIQYVGPDTYILLDAEGRPQAMPGMTYEDFMAAWKESQQAGPPERQPRFTIESVQISGQAGTEHAELQFVVQIQHLADGPLDVPLGLVGAILQGEPRLERDERRADQLPETAAPPKVAKNGDAARNDYLDFDPAQGGFIAHLAGTAGDRHTVSLELLVPLLRDGAATTLSLNCPRALAAKMTLDVDTPVTEASVSSGALLSRQPVADGGTRLTVAGLAGLFRLTWSTAEIAAAELNAVLSATGAIQATIDGRSVRTDARITVRSYGGGFDRIRVRLPQGATLIQDRAGNAEKEPGYRVTTEPLSSDGNLGQLGGNSGQVVLIQLNEKQPGPVTIELATEQPLGLLDTDLAVRLAGFEVLGAVRQFGDVALRVADDWQLRWDTGRHVRQVDFSELEPALQNTEITAAFQYDRQPWSLGVRVAARQGRIQVTPDYVMECLPDEVRLRVHLTYQILGVRAFQFPVDLAGWELTDDPVESGGLVDRDRIHLTSEGQLVLPLLQASTRRAEVTFFVRRAVPRAERRLSLPLPVPVAESIATGDLVVRAAAGIELMPHLLDSTGLTATPITTNGTDDRDDMHEFRYRCFLPEAVFVADRVARLRDVSIKGSTHIDAREVDARVVQKFDYSVRFEPIGELAFEIPNEVPFEEGAAEIALLSAADAGESGEIRQRSQLKFAFREQASTPPAVAGSNGLRTIRVTLPQPRLGRFLVEILYPVARPQARAEGASWAVPLVLPVEGDLTEMRATVDTPREVGVVLDPAADVSTWTAVVDAAQGSAAGLGDEFLAAKPEAWLPLSLKAVDLNTPSATVVDRMWLQTWITDDMRQERAAFRFRTVGRLVTVELPPETVANEVEVLLDGATAGAVSREVGRITVELASAAAEAENGSVALMDALPHTLELRYRRMTNDRIITRRRFTPPQWIGMTALSEVYWQIILPGDAHVIQSPRQLAADSEWQWLGSFWGRRPTKSQAELEEWVGAVSQLAPTAAQNEYLYSGLAAMSSIEIVTAPRWLIVLAASGVVLALALVWFYLPAVRRGWILVGMACLLAGLAAAFPTPAALLAQASVLGVGLAALAALIARLGSRTSQWHLPVSTSSPHRPVTPRADSGLLPPLAAAGASTAPTVQLRAAESER